MVKGDYKAGKRPWFIVPNVYTTGGSWYWCAVCNKNLGAGHEDTERHGRKQQWAEWAFVHDPLKFQEEFSWVFGASPQATTPAPLADATFNPLAQLSLRQALALLDEGQADTPEAALRRGPAQMAFAAAPRPVRHGPALPKPSQKPEEEEEKSEEEIPWELARCMTKCWRDAQQSAGNHEAELRDAGPGADGSVDQRRVRPRRQPGAAGRGAKTPKPHRRW